MRHLLKALAIAISALLLALGAATPANAATGFFISNGRLYDANGQQFIMRGINHPHAWYLGETASFQEISNLGANSVRVVLSSGSAFPRTSANDVRTAIDRCKSARLVCVLEVHDTTGYRDWGGAPAGAQSMLAAVQYWKDIASVVKGQERYVIINIGNEPYGNQGNTKVYDWTKDSVAAIKEMRNAGFTHTLMIDAPNWGQDWTNTMKEDGGLVLAADTQRNTMLSVHMYSVYQSQQQIYDYLNHFVWNRWPIVVGEFGSEQNGEDVNEDAIMRSAQTLGVGYLGWSYSGNGGVDTVLDLVRNFDPGQLTTWGRTLLDHPAGIRATARRASVF